MAKKRKSSSSSLNKIYIKNRDWRVLLVYNYFAILRNKNSGWQWKDWLSCVSNRISGSWQTCVGFIKQGKNFIQYAGAGRSLAHGITTGKQFFSSWDCSLLWLHKYCRTLDGVTLSSLSCRDQFFFFQIPIFFNYAYIYLFLHILFLIIYSPLFCILAHAPVFFFFLSSLSLYRQRLFNWYL